MKPLNKPVQDEHPTPRVMRGVDRAALREQLTKRFEHTLRRLAE